jgi:hypothetical protein
MPEQGQNFVLVPYTESAPKPSGLVARLRTWLAAASTLVPQPAVPPAPLADDVLRRPRLVFGFDATASREPAWAAARRVTDALVQALPGELDVALAVHGGSTLHTFTDFTSDPRTLRDRAAGITCIAGRTRMLAILRTSLERPGVRVIVYIGDVYEESLRQGRTLADALGLRGIKLIVLHDTTDPAARLDAETFLDLARRTGGAVLPFDASAPQKLRELLAAVAVYAVGGTELLERKRAEMPGALLLLEHLGGKR